MWKIKRYLFLDLTERETGPGIFIFSLKNLHFAVNITLENSSLKIYFTSNFCKGIKCEKRFKHENEIEKNWSCNRVLGTGLMAIYTQEPRANLQGFTYDASFFNI
ncbi:hypothetical protein BpHYR1_009149 [Brachionus plicatilis]|uniref:Uncharacterized protein n=1 Tax=Brachionus plicatilis TaxID=10195 RepID=A0A3M7PP79_BRAPC|nr:hypothetical protein BpHYR1_009149 [Brachionus plicatilis]